MFYITKGISFDACHFLPRHVGKCANMHGHTWKVAVTVCGQDLEAVGPNSGMILDFAHLKSLMKVHIADRFDHKMLNDELYNPTAENIAFDIYYALEKHWAGTELKYKLHSVRVYEGDSSWAEYKED